MAPHQLAKNWLKWRRENHSLDFFTDESLLSSYFWFHSQLHQIDYVFRLNHMKLLTRDHFLLTKKWQFHVDQPNNSRSYIVPQILTSWYFNDKSEVGNLLTSFIKSIVKHYGVAGVWKAHGDTKAIPTNGTGRKRRETQHGQHVHHGPPASSTVSGF